MINIILNYLEKFIAKNKDANIKIFECTMPVVRNRYKRNAFVIPFNKPQCPIFKDNRCCGGCKIIKTCKHFVDCHCFGFVQAARGSDPKKHKTSKYSIGFKNGTMNWEKYEIAKEKASKKSSKCRFCNGTGKVPEKKYSAGSSFSNKNNLDNVCGICNGEGIILGI